MQLFIAEKILQDYEVRLIQIRGNEIAIKVRTYIM